MEAGEADALWRRFTDVDAAAKRGHGIGFEEQQAFEEAMQRKFPVAAGLDATKHHITGLTSQDQSRRIDKDEGTTRADLKSTFRKAAGGLESEQIHDDPTAIPGYSEMTPAERIRARVKFASQRASRQRDTQDKDRGWTRFVFNKHGTLDDEALEQVPDEAAVKLGTMYAVDKRDAAEADRVIRDSGNRALTSQQQHDAAIFGAPVSAEKASHERAGSGREHDGDARRRQQRHQGGAERSRDRDDGSSRRDDGREDRHRYRSAADDERHLQLERDGHRKRRRSRSPDQEGHRSKKSRRHRDREDHARRHGEERHSSPSHRRRGREGGTGDWDQESERERRRRRSRSRSPRRRERDGRHGDDSARGRRERDRDAAEYSAQGRREEPYGRQDARRERTNQHDASKVRCTRRDSPIDHRNGSQAKDGREGGNGHATLQPTDSRVHGRGDAAGASGQQGTEGAGVARVEGEAGHDAGKHQGVGERVTAEVADRALPVPWASGISGQAHNDIAALLQHSDGVQLEGLRDIDVPEGAVVEVDPELLGKAGGGVHALHADLDAGLAAQLSSKKGSWRDRIRAGR